MILTTRSKIWWLAAAPASLLIGGFLLLPALLGFLSTLTDYGPGKINWQLQGISNYEKVLAAPPVRAAFTNAVLLTLMSLPLEIGLGLALAGLLRRPFRGRSLVRTLLLLPWLVSPIASGVMWHFLFNSQVGLTGWLGGLLGLREIPNPTANPGLALPALALTEIWRLTPLASFLLLPGLLSVPQDNLDYATLEGSPWWHTLWKVVLPRMRLLLLTVVLLLVGQTLTTFDDVLVLTGGGPGQRTTTPALFSYNLAIVSHNWPQGVTSAWLLVGLVGVIALVYLLLGPGERSEGNEG